MFSRYYRFAGEPMHFAAQWGGLPPAVVRRGSRELGEANFYESSGPGNRTFRPLVVARRAYDASERTIDARR